MLLRSKKLLILYMVLLVVVLLTMAQLLLLRRQANTDGPRDFPEIRQEGVLRIAMEYSPTDYFIVGDSVLGFQYELCQAISSLAGIEIQTRLETSLATCFDLLSDRQVDVIAQNIPVTTDNNWIWRARPCIFPKIRRPSCVCVTLSVRLAIRSISSRMRSIRRSN